MSEWTVVTALVVLLGLIASIVKPLINLNTTLVKLGDSVETLRRDLKAQREQSETAHEEIWAHEDEQDKKLSEHESRIRGLEAR